MIALGRWDALPSLNLEDAEDCGVQFDTGVWEFFNWDAAIWHHKIRNYIVPFFTLPPRRMFSFSHELCHLHFSITG